MASPSRIETSAVLQLIDGLPDGNDEASAAELRRSISQHSEVVEDASLALRAIALCGVKVGGDEKLVRVGRCRVKRKATFKSNWQPRVLLLTSTQLVVMAPKEKAKHHVQLELALVTVAKKDDNSLEVTPADDDKNSIVLQFDSTAERDSWNAEVQQVLS
jgi:hypothetical protein